MDIKKRIMLRIVVLLAAITLPLVLAPTTAGAVTCGGTAYAPPYTLGQARYGPVSSANTAVIGHPGYRKSYSFRVQGNVPRVVGVKALGFQNGRATWYNLGISSTGLSGSVPWGNVLAVPKIRAASNGAGGYVTWTC